MIKSITMAHFGHFWVILIGNDPDKKINWVWNRALSIARCFLIIKDVACRIS